MAIDHFKKKEEEAHQDYLWQEKAKAQGLTTPYEKDQWIKEQQRLEAMSPEEKAEHDKTKERKAEVKATEEKIATQKRVYDKLIEELKSGKGMPADDNKFYEKLEKFEELSSKELDKLMKRELDFQYYDEGRQYAQELAKVRRGILVEKRQHEIIDEVEKTDKGDIDKRLDSLPEETKEKVMTKIEEEM